MYNTAYCFDGFSDRLKTERKKLNKTQEELSELLGFNSKYIARLESGIHLPSINALILLANCFNVSVDYLLFGTQNNNANERLQKIISKLSHNEQEILADLAQSLVKHSTNKSDN